jgi:hypothetical protein
MSQGAQIDYDALAKQAGAISSQLPQQGGAVDYDALAKQAGAISSEPPGFWDRVKQVLKPQPVPDTRNIPGYDPRHAGMPGSAEGANLAEGLSDWDKASFGQMGGGIADIFRGNVAKGGHKVIQGAGSATLPALPFLAPLAAANPGVLARVVGGGAVGQTIGQKGASLLGANPDQAALAGDVAGIAGGYGGAKLPSFLRGVNPAALKAGASAAFDTASQAAGANAVDAEGAGQAALGAKDLQDVGRTMPRVMQKFLQRVTAPEAEPLSYDEARRFYSAAGEMSANEKAAYTPAMKRLLNQFRNQLVGAIQQTADNAGVGTEYGQAMSDYAKAKRLDDTWETVWDATKKNLLPGLIKGLGIGAGGTAAYGAYKTFSK